MLAAPAVPPIRHVDDGFAAELAGPKDLYLCSQGILLFWLHLQWSLELPEEVGLLPPELSTLYLYLRDSLEVEAQMTTMLQAEEDALGIRITMLRSREC